MSAVPLEWLPVWEMSPSQRLDYAELRASLEALGCACLTCLDVGLPCYHVERYEMTRVLAVLFNAGAAPMGGLPALPPSVP